MKTYEASIKTPFAHLGISCVANKLAAVDFIAATNEIIPTEDSALNICKQIRQYLDNPGAKYQFHISCVLQGTPFQQKVWRELETIPAGEVVTYGELAHRLGTSARAVGNACRKNPLPLVVPCHRVVSTAGLGGYAGDTGGEMLRIKSWLLQHEGAIIN